MAVNKNSLKNLKPFRKGIGGNPKGRPLGIQNSSTRLSRLLNLIQNKKNRLNGEMEEFTVAERMDMALIVKAIKGDVGAYREIMDRWEGKVQQRVEVDNTTKNGYFDILKCIQVTSESKHDNNSDFTNRILPFGK